MGLGVSTLATGTLTLSEVRAQAAIALAPAEDGDPDVLSNVVDAPTPPALMLLWDDPWLEPKGMSACIWTARMDVLCIAQRVEPGAGVEKLEELVTFVLGRMAADAFPWPVARVVQPGIHYPGGVPYLGARVRYELTVSL